MSQVFLSISFILKKFFLKKLFLSTSNMSWYMTAGGSWSGAARHSSTSGGQRKDFFSFLSSALFLEG